MILPILKYANPLLRRKCEPITEITDEIRTLARDMDETMKASNGLGLSGSQVGKMLRICVSSPPIEDENGKCLQAPTKVYINPVLTDPSENMWLHSEGCLSIPGIYEDVMRPVSITVTALDLDGNEFTERLEGWPARVLMHENDHLNGVLFIDRIDKKRRNIIEPRLRKLKKKH